MAKWSLPIDKYVKALKGDVEKAGRAVALDIFSRIIVKTPVDTGRARGNWMIDINRAPEGMLTVGFGPGVAEGGDRGANASAAQANAMLQAERLVRFRVGATISIRNTLPYIVKLEHGHSGQAPAGMVKVTLQEVGAIVADVTSRVRRGGQ
jgi:hypothetical protein